MEETFEKFYFTATRMWPKNSVTVFTLTFSWKSIHCRYTLIPVCEQYFVYRWDDDMKGAYHSAK